jgi:multidrug transporter EmrE-like cation transporter
MLYLLWSIAVAGGVLYQVVMKKVGPSTNAFALLVGAYLVAAAVSGVAYFVVPSLFGAGPGISRGPGSVMPPLKLIVGVAGAIFLIELGNALALGTGNVDISLFVPVEWGAIVLIASVIGMAMFRETISPLKAVGIGLVVGGILLIKFAK